MVRLVTLLSLWFASSVAVAAPQASYTEFKDRFDKSVAIGANDDLQRLVQSQELWAIQLVMETAEAIANAPSERIQLRMEPRLDAPSATNIHGGEVRDAIAIAVDRGDSIETRDARGSDYGVHRAVCLCEV